MSVFLALRICFIVFSYVSSIGVYFFIYRNFAFSFFVSADNIISQNCDLYIHAHTTLCMYYLQQKHWKNYDFSIIIIYRNLQSLQNVLLYFLINILIWLFLYGKIYTIHLIYSQEILKISLCTELINLNFKSFSVLLHLRTALLQKIKFKRTSEVLCKSVLFAHHN